MMGEQVTRQFTVRLHTANSTVCTSLVFNSFTQKRLATKSRELNYDLLRGSTFKPHNKTDMHLDFIR